MVGWLLPLREYRPGGRKQRSPEGGIFMVIDPMAVVGASKTPEFWKKVEGPSGRASRTGGGG